MNKEKPFVSILNYHGLARRGEDADGRYTLGVEAFREQMDTLSQGFTVISLGQFGRWFRGEALPGRPVVLTFDDGKESDYSVAFPILKHRNFPAAFFVNPGTVGTTGYLSVEMLREMSRSGMEIGSHGFDHLFLTRLSDRDLHGQLTSSKKRLEALLGKEIFAFSVPRGRYNRRVLEAAREAGYQMVFTSDIGPNDLGCDPFRLRRWAMRRTDDLSDFISVVEGRPKKRLLLEQWARESAYHLLGHTFYESVRNHLLKEGKK